MPLSFLLNNLHFVFEIFGALSFFIMAWLAFDAYSLKKNRIAGLKMAGFALLTAWFVIHAFSFDTGLLGYAGYAAYIVGILLVLLSLIVEKPAPRPEFQAVIVLPSITAIIVPLNVATTIGLFAITLFAILQYRTESKKSLKPFFIGFLFLSLGSLASIFYKTDSLSTLWAIGHILEIAGFASLGWWVWQYLQLRIREELVLIFVSMALLITTLVTLVFSTILVNRIESETKTNLLSNARVLDFALLGLKEESLAKAKFLAKNDNIQKALLENDFIELEKLLTRSMEQEKLGFLTLLDADGFVIMRAHALTQKGDDLSGEKAVSRGLRGLSFVVIESSEAEMFSIRAVAPILSGQEITGIIVTGFPLDNVLVDSIKRITKLEMSIFEGNTRVATTIFNPDGRTRSTGIKIANRTIEEEVLQSGQEATSRIDILSRPFLASYLPIFDDDNNVIGMISSAKPQQELLETASATNKLTFMMVGIIMLILAVPMYFTTKRLSQEIS